MSLAAVLDAGGPVSAGPRYDFDRKQLEAVMADLKAWLPGSWDSYPQIWYERNVAMPDGGEHEHWHRSFALIDAPQVGDVVFYGQINIGGRDGPIMARSQVLYKAEIDETRGVVVINGQGPSDPGRFENLHERPELWGEVQMRDEEALHCDFVWRRDGRQLVGVLEGKSPESRRYGPGTCTYVAASGAEFFADAEWVLSPEELWLYDINTMGGVRFVGREDRTHIRLYRARPYRCSLRMLESGSQQTVELHDRGGAAGFSIAGTGDHRLRLLRAWYPAAGGYGLDDQLRLLIEQEQGPAARTAAVARPLAARLEAEAPGIRIACDRQDRFPSMDSRH